MFTDNLLGQDIPNAGTSHIPFRPHGRFYTHSFKLLFMYGKASDFSKCPKNIVTDLFPLAS